MEKMEDNLKEIELRTFNETPLSDTAQNKDLNDSTLCFENRDYLSMGGGVDPLNDGTGSLGSGYEEMKYESMTIPASTTYDDIETHTADLAVYENCPPGNCSGLNADKPMNIIKKLRIGKSTYSFWKYSIFVVSVIFNEVELLIYLDIFYILAGLLLLGFAVRNFNNCPLSASLDYLVFCFAGSSIVSGGMNVCIKCQPRPSIYHVFETTAYRSVRILMIVCCLLDNKGECCSALLTFPGRFYLRKKMFAGLVEVYVRFPPEEYDMKKPNYCSPTLYWSVVYIFTLTASIVALIIFHIIIAFVWYFL